MAALQALAQGSNRTTTVDGVKYIVHQVEPKETLYALSRAYGVTVDDIKEANPDIQGGIRIGQELLVPYREAEAPEPGPGMSHVVKPKETLFSISREYNVSLDALRSANNLRGNAITIGQQLIIPTEEMAQAEGPTTAQVNSRPEDGIHIVKAKETLFSISQTYGLSVEKLMELNGLKTPEILIGQVIVVDEKARDTARGGNGRGRGQGNRGNQGNQGDDEGDQDDSDAAEPDDASNDDERNDEPGDESEEMEEDDDDAEETDEEEEDNADEGKIVQKGIAEVIEGAADGQRHLALHRTAPVGTILTVVNELNNKQVYVRVVGSFPLNGDNEKLLIKLSPLAFELLGGIDKRFPVEVSYIP